MLRRTTVLKLPVTWRTITGPDRRAVAACVRCSRAWPVTTVHLVFSASEVLAGADKTSLC